jgi:YHS domain-containing protein
MKLQKSLLFLLFSMAAIFLAACAGNVEGVKKINTTAENVAIKGFDTVAFFTAESAVEGNPQYSFIWNGAKWYFSNAENMEKFRANPEQYAPQFGGYCSWAVSKGYTADGDPNAWKIVDGKLYLNYNQKVKEKWEAEQPKLIEDGRKNWEEFKKKKPEHKG